MEHSIGKSFTGQLQWLLKYNEGFSQKFNQRLVLESNKVKNPFQFIVGLFKEGVLSDGSSDPEANFGLKAMIAQLAMMLACSKGADAMDGLMKALDESGNSESALSLRDWVQDYFSMKSDGALSDLREGTSAAQTKTTEKLPKSTTSQNEVSCGGKFIDQVMEQVRYDLMEQVEAYAKKAVALALENANNARSPKETNEWLESSPARNKNCPIAVKTLASQPKAEESTFFEQAAPLDELSKVATLKYPQKSAAKGTSLVQFDKKRMMACAADGTLNLWNWRGHQKEPIKIAAKVKNITCFEYDEEIIVVGTADGTVHLFDARTAEEKWSVRLAEPVIALKFVESTLVVITQDDEDEDVWWIDISRPDMRLLNHRTLKDWKGYNDCIPGICACPDISFIYSSEWVNVHDTKSGKQLEDDNNDQCYLTAPADINTLAVGDLISMKRVVVAGCIGGEIVMWSTSEFMEDQSPVKSFEGHDETAVSLCFFNGHLISLDESGKLLMWSGHDLENVNISKPVPRVLAAKGFSNATSLFAHERWFATSSPKDGVINVWTLPDLWLRTG